MKKFFLLLLLAVVALSANSQADILNRRLSLHHSSIAISTFLDKLSKETGATFSFDAAAINLSRRVSIDVENATVAHILAHVFKDKYCFIQKGKFIIITKCKEKKKPEQQEEKRLTPTSSPRLDALEVPEAIQVGGSPSKASIFVSSSAPKHQQAPVAPPPLPSLATVNQPTSDNGDGKEANMDDSIGSARLSPIQVSFVYPIGTSGRASEGKRYYLSINTIGGHTGGAKVELAGIFNMNTQLTEGFQAAGIFNKTTKSTSNVQLAGILNTVSEGNTTVQLAGMANLNRGEAGIQAAGLVNVNKESAKVQVAGIANINKESITFQAAGIFNASNISSTQIAPINITHKGGLQVGLVNVRDTTDGWMIGLVNIAKNGGFLEVEVAGGDFITASTSLRTGVKRLYSIVSVGVCYPSKAYTQGFGVGSIIYSKGKWDGGLEALFNGISSKSTSESGFSSLLQVKASVSYRIAGRYAIFLAPTLNTYASISATESPISLPSHSFWNAKGTKGEAAMWIGFHAGIRFNLKRSPTSQ